MKIFLLVSTFIGLLFWGNVSAQSSVKFYPGNKTLLFIGQDMGAIGGFEAPDNNGYYENVGVVAAGITTYTSVNKLEAIYKIDNWGSGNVCASCIVSNSIYKNSALAIGLYMVNQLDSVGSGYHDAKIIELATWIKSTNRPVFLRIGYEFDGSWNSYNPEKYKTAFKRIVDKFRQENVENTVFVWQSSGSGDSTYLMKWYPGDDYVDWVAYSHFDNNGSGILKIGRGHAKPVMIAEATPKQTLSTGDGLVHWNSWFAPFFKYIHDNSDIIKVVAYINVNWNSQSLWAGQGWGDSRVEANAVVKEKWLGEINTDFWMQASDTLFKTLNYTATNGTENQRENQFILYPNPLTDKRILNIELAEKIETVLIFDSEGKLIKQVKIPELVAGICRLDFQGINNGVYTVQLYGINFVYTKKIVLL